MSLVSVDSFNVDNIVFEEVKKCTTGSVSYQRIPIKYMVNGKKDELVVETPVLFTYGVQENRQRDDKAVSQADKPVESYSLSLVMADEPTTCLFEQILERCKEHLRQKSTQKALSKFNLPVDVMNIFYRKREDGEVVEGVPPTMYPKLYTEFCKHKSSGIPPKITTKFYDLNDEPIDPLTLVGKRADVQAAVVVRDIYVGTSPIIQLKVNDVIVHDIKDARRRLLRPTVKPVAKSVFAEPEKSDSEEEDIEKQQPIKLNKIVRRRV